MRYSLIAVGALLIYVALSTGACASRKPLERPQLSELSDTTDICLYMDRICREAEEFQREFNRMPEEQQKDLYPVLQSRIEHCERAINKCYKSIE
ncbi:hypothetical protein [Chitinivibrio alkaliphilus]|uniref:Lipoprotein n=1 Tax=Chitinivibrio alkaliphilus ACht1 TaxID=1313304 RepID=U7D5W7_9BACT|nr:hypothetical protein [Chitinivibrio alkaliphilus]ERP30961.1 hypothetical protein CALK_2156 [Chitinivibrio alkaliphilus ACht1]